jgi:hypothetical protein
VRSIAELLQDMASSPLPTFDARGVLPAFIGPNATKHATRSPFKATIHDLVTRFAYTKERATLLLGLNAYRERLFDRGFIDGMQWIDGSFVEDVERLHSRPPRDIDLITLFRRPKRYAANLKSWKEDFEKKIFFDLFEPNANKFSFNCDTYALDLDGKSESIIEQSAYWLGLFSQQRTTQHTKGIVSIPLASNLSEFRAVSAEIKAKFDV